MLSNLDNLKDARHCAAECEPESQDLNTDFADILQPKHSQAPKPIFYMSTSSCAAPKT